MKKLFNRTTKPTFILGFLFVFCLAFNGNTQYYTIPDPLFAQWLTDNYPTCISGDQLDTTCSEILNETNLYIPLLTITSIEGVQFFDNLDTLTLENMQLSSLPRLPSGLENLTCSGAQLSTLPDLPNSIRYLACGWNQLTTLPELPDSLRIFDCSNNLLTHLPDLPDSLKAMTSSYNQLSSLPELHDELEFIDISFNQFTSLPNLPTNLTAIFCDNNQLGALPEMPDGIKIVYCHFNQLVSMPDLPDTLERLICSYNQIQCFEWLPVVTEYVEITNNSFTCVPNVTSYSQGYPLCEFNDPLSNPNNCTSYHGILGKVFKDQTDCLNNGNEQNQFSVPLKLYDNNGDFQALSFSNSSGEYFFPTDNGTYRVELDSSILGITAYCYDDTTVTVSGNLIDSTDFFLDCGSASDLAINGIVPSGLVFPGQIHQLSVFGGYSLLHHSLGCFQSVSGTVKIIIDGPITFESTSGAWTPSQINGNEFSYDISDFSQINLDDPFVLNLLTDTTAQSGDLICATAIVTINGIDINSVNDTLQLCYEAINSYDPNHKEVYPDSVAEGFDDFLIYTIQFQNTGTAPAINIRLEDTLSSHLNLETFELLQSSHSVVTSLYGNRLVFRFNNIQLADSTNNEPESHGFAQFRIKPLPGLVHGTVIQNNASIYFDYNIPVVTNYANVTYMPPNTYSTDSRIECDSLVWIDGNTYTSSNNSATFTLTNAAGGDSIITLNLTIEIIDLTITDNAPILTANAVGATYQWIDCDNGNALIGNESSATFTATTNGNYAVIITQNDCSDTSDCIQVVHVGLSEKTDNHLNIAVFPNPSTDSFHIQSGSTINSLSVYTLSGQCKYQATINTNSFTIDLSKETSGVYLLETKIGDQYQYTRLMKQ
jgi:uncharacterized repeat protein (TIGR01451 family)